MSKILEKVKAGTELNQPNLIDFYKELYHLTVNGLRDDKFKKHYFDGVEFDNWEIN